jgi:hemoglobin-like flavoprotein
MKRYYLDLDSTKEVTIEKLATFYKDESEAIAIFNKNQQEYRTYEIASTLLPLFNVSIKSQSLIDKKILAIVEGMSLMSLNASNYQNALKTLGKTVDQIIDQASSNPVASALSDNIDTSETSEVALKATIQNDDGVSSSSSSSTITVPLTVPVEEFVLPAPRPWVTKAKKK